MERATPYADPQPAIQAIREFLLKHIESPSYLKHGGGLRPRLYVGRHLGSRHVRCARARRVTVKPLAPMPVFDMDGEPYPSREATFSLLPAALRVAAPPRAER